MTSPSLPYKESYINTNQSYFDILDFPIIFMMMSMCPQCKKNFCIWICWNFKYIIETQKMPLCIFVLGGCRMLDTQLKASDIWLKLDYTITNVPIKTSCIIHSCASRHDNYLINILPTWGSAETGLPVIPCHAKASSVPLGWVNLHRGSSWWVFSVADSHHDTDSHHRAKSVLLGHSFFFAFFPIIWPIQ